MKSTRILALVVFGIFVSQAHAIKSMVATGGSCTSQGVWTTQALAQSQAIFETATRLKDDPDCKALAEAVGSVQISQMDVSADDQKGAGDSFETLPKELDSLRAILAEQPENQSLVSRMTPILAQATLDLVTNTVGIGGPLSAEAVKPIQERLVRTSDTGLTMLSKVLTVMPSAKQCLDRNPNDAVVLLSAVTKLSAAFVSSGESIGSGFSNLIAQYVNFLREMEYAGILQKLNQEKFWTDMSCLIETTQQAYCNVKDGFKLLEYEAKELQLETQVGASENLINLDKSPLEGYFLLLREAPTISAWLQRVQFGIEPKLLTDAQFKNDTWDTVTNLMKDLNRLQGQYNENLLIYQGLGSVEQKQQNIRVLIQSLVGTMAAGGARGSVNFFTQAVPETKLPFYLIGRDKIPDEVLGINASNVALDPFTYLFIGSE